MHVNPTTTERPAAKPASGASNNKAAPAAKFGDFLKNAQQAATPAPAQGLTPSSSPSLSPTPAAPTGAVPTPTTLASAG